MAGLGPVRWWASGFGGWGGRCRFPPSPPARHPPPPPQPPHPGTVPAPMRAPESLMQTPAELLDPTTNGAANGSAHSEEMAEAAENGLNGDARGLAELLHALQSMRVGDFSVRMAGDRVGIMGKIADTFNEIVATNQRMAKQVERVGQVVGREGKTRQRVRLGLSDGAWGEMEASVNSLIDDLLWPTTEVTRAIAAVAQGDLLRTVSLDVDGRPLQGEFLRSAEIVNTMIKQLNVFTSEVTRVAREVGIEGKLGGQAQVGGV